MLLGLSYHSGMFTTSTPPAVNVRKRRENKKSAGMSRRFLTKILTQTLLLLNRGFPGGRRFGRGFRCRLFGGRRFGRRCF
jgi:hypothetical protein